jgi:hypothetical protein
MTNYLALSMSLLVNLWHGVTPYSSPKRQQISTVLHGITSPHAVRTSNLILLLFFLYRTQTFYNYGLIGCDDMHYHRQKIGTNILEEPVASIFRIER